MARYLLSTHTVDGEAREPMSDDDMERLMARIGALEEEMRSAGAWVFSGRLHGPDTATVVRNQGGELLTTDGPFAEAKEQFAGYLTVDCESEERALDIARRWPDPRYGGAIEVRALMDQSGTEM